ncbi:heptaprenyl diphosphate synthase component 1 [Bhargavaea cecembensis]|uniref:heptaprenyl diphosphate synthase component 1 n=1 Tax=Bhargavaea cecembensis TaxID=394098 RepID=UPI000694E08F|nr:heptaprenyl diphosphate synthase component 1 [Bhargavaea cecembensis]
MKASPIHTEIEQLNIRIRNRLANRMLLEHTGNPVIGGPAMFALVLPELNGEPWGRDDRHAAEAVGALHAAFHAHDSIEDRGHPSRRQQLTVLAGDYYSGVHYRILTGIPDIRLLHGLSLAVIAMSERKAGLYEARPESSAGELLDGLGTIEAAALTVFFDSRGLELYELTVRHALIAGRLAGELANLDSGNETPFVSAILRSADILGDREKAADVMDAARRESVASALAGARELGAAGHLTEEEICLHLGIGEPASTQTGKKV